MKIEDKIDESSVQGFMFGLVILGPAAGKLKYTLLDKQDITLLQNHLLEAYVEIDRNGQGAQIFAFAYDVKKGKESGRYVHEILWEKYYGGIAPGFKVVHKNGITVDNRVENLMLCPKNVSHSQCASQKSPEDSLYWAAVVEMPHEAEPLYMKLFTSQEELSLMKEERYFECHYPPCTKMEQRPQEFSICGLCQVTRYCSSACQTRDWTWHKPICNQRPRPIFIESYPDR
ncbi:zinc finger MYND domain-containing protein 19-like [Argiope bruennichi]|uniref:zinc finger MYND domain-containing protein 19-like n=1 Tax=Argiope bruennichi TaxID=94029 RepID=UPI002494011B|nr:zinc finger MYND domain-containing protein 19-like [Argiope bruennichi]